MEIAETSIQKRLREF